MTFLGFHAIIEEMKRKEGEALLFHHYLWDFDGTLFNTYPHMTRAMQRALAECGCEPPYEEIFFWMKRSVTQAIQHFQDAFPNLEALGNLGERYQRHETEDSQELVQPYEGIPQLLRDLQARGGVHYLYTHRGASAFLHLKAFQMDGLFLDAVTAEDHFPSKPAPDAIQYLLQKHRIPSREAVMMGDRDIDVLAGQNAGIAGFLFDPNHFYSECGADLRCSSIQEMRSLLLGTDA